MNNVKEIPGQEATPQIENPIEKVEKTPKDELRGFIKTDLEVAIGFLNILRANPDIIEAIITILEPSYVQSKSRKNGLHDKS